VTALEQPAAQVVSRFEATLLRILHLFLRRDPTWQALPLVFEEMTPPRCLSRAAVELVKDALGRGCVQLLARGGWWREPYLRAGLASTGRLWERPSMQELALSFSQHTLRFLLWITAQNPADKKKNAWPVPPPERLTGGDLLLFYLAQRMLRDSSEGILPRVRPLFASHGLCRLAYPEDFAPGGPAVAPLLTRWTTGGEVWILEALQQELATRWLEVERNKGTITDWGRLGEVGLSQEQVLDAFLDALERANRPDLARFLLVVLAELLPEWRKDATAWLGSLRGSRPRTLAGRVGTQRAALVLLRQLDRLRRWDQQARNVAFFDENYAASQLWKADWERFQGEQLWDRARTILREVEPLQPNEERS
jgi:FtsH ternary system-associated peptide